MALKNPSANCFRKFKGLQLTFQVVYSTQKRGCAEPGPNSALMAIAASRCCQKLLTMLLRHVAGEPKVWSVVRVPSEVDEDRRQLQWQGGWPASRLSWWT